MKPLSSRSAIAVFRIVVFAFVAALMLTAAAGTASANTFIVNLTTDTDDGACTPTICTLRDAINAANADARWTRSSSTSAAARRPLF